MKAIPALVLSLIILGAAQARAYLQLSVTALTANSITFSISGTLEGPDPSDSSSPSKDDLWIELPGTEWISNTLSVKTTTEVISGETTYAVHADTDDITSSYGDYFFVEFANDLVSGSSTGNGTSVTFTFDSDVFEPANVPDLSKFELFWGWNSEDTQPFGVLQIVNIFSSLETDGWVSPTDTTDNSAFGWFYASYYPWIYSVSADELANSGTYKGDGTGWVYVVPEGASFTGGFYIYRGATSSWAYTNYNWSGWVYDYTAAAWVDLTPVQN